MTLGEVLEFVNFYYEKDEDNGTLVICDSEDPNYEEEVNTIQEAINLISGHLESQAEGMVEWVTNECNEAVLSVRDWTWADYADYIKGRLPNLSKELQKTCKQAIDVFTALSDINSIEL